MQTNVLCSLPRKRKLPDQKLRVLLEIVDFPKRLSPRLELHPFSRPPTGINRGFMAGGFWLALLLPVVPLLACPAFHCPGRLLNLSRPLSSSGLFLCRHIFRSFFCTSHFEQIVNRTQAAVLSTRLSACRSTSDGASRNI